VGRRPLSCLTALLVSGCTVELTAIPELPDSIRSAILLLSAEGRVRVIAGDLDPPLVTETVGDADLSLYVLGHEKTLDELGLVAGDLALGGPNDSVFPKPDLVLYASVSGKARSELEELDALPPPFDVLRLDLPSQRACLESGGCLEAPDAAGYAACRLPCGERAAPIPATPASAPLFLPCPSGWREHNEAGVTTCDPYPEDRISCAIGSIQAPGSIGCVHLGPACERFAADLPTDRPIVFVDAAAVAGGDGSRARPFETLTAGLAAAPPGTIVALAGGEITAPLSLDDGDVIWGNCPEEARVIVQGALPSVELRGGRAELHGLRISGGDRIAVEALGSTLSLSNVWIDTSSHGIVIAGARLEAEDLGLDGAAIRFEAGSSGAIRRTSSRNAPQTALTIVASEVTAADLAIARAGDGIAVDGGGLVLERAALSIVGGTGLALEGRSTASVTDLTIEGDADADGLRVDHGRLQATRLRVEGVGASMSVVGDGSLAMLDVVVSDSGNEARGYYAATVSDATLALRRGLFLRPQATAIRARGTEATLELADVIFTGSVTGEAPSRGRGVRLELDALARLERVGFERLRGEAIDMTDGAQLIGDDLRFVDISPYDERQGRAIELSGMSTAHLVRVEIHGASTAGLVARYGAEVVAEDLLIEDIEVGSCLGCSYTLGDAISGLADAKIDLLRFRFRRLGQAGVRVDAESTLLIREGTIEDAPVGLYAEHGPNNFATMVQRVLLEDVDTPILP
jgi:hypothetical protein